MFEIMAAVSLKYGRYSRKESDSFQNRKDGCKFQCVKIATEP